MKWIQYFNTTNTEYGFNYALPSGEEEHYIASSTKNTKTSKVVIAIGPNGIIKKAFAKDFKNEFDTKAIYEVCKFWETTSHENIDELIEHKKVKRRIGNTAFVYEDCYDPTFDYYKAAKGRFYRGLRQYTKELKPPKVYSRPSCRSIIVTHIETGKEYTFESIREAVKQLGLTKSSVNKCLSGIRNQHKGYSFRHVDPTWNGTLSTQSRELVI